MIKPPEPKEKSKTLIFKARGPAFRYVREMTVKVSTDRVLDLLADVTIGEFSIEKRELKKGVDYIIKNANFDDEEIRKMQSCARRYSDKKLKIAVVCIEE